jgi:DNA-binding PucR family transcriptional regulator
MPAARQRQFGAVPPRSAGCVDLIGSVGERLDGKRAAIADEIVDRLRPEIREFVTHPSVADEFLPATIDCLTLVHAMARSWSDPHNVPPPESAIRWARGLVGHGLPSIVLLRTFRLGQAVYQDLWYEELRQSSAPPELLLEAVHVAGVFVSVWVDAITQSLLEAYEDEREVQMRGAGAIRAEALRRVLDGSLRDERAASLRLAYELGRTHQALVLWTARSASDSEQDWTDWSGRVVEVLASRGKPLVVESSPGFVLGCVSGRASAEEVARFAASALGTPVRIALGTPHAGLDGLRRTVGEARRAQRVAALLLPDRPIVGFDEAEVLDLLTRDLDAARSFVHRVLGQLAGADETAERLRATLAAYHDRGMSYAAAGRRLGIHENSVASRLRRASELGDGLDVSSWEVRAAVALAALIRPETS